MEITTIIAEFNPFHLGHKKIIDFAKASWPEDALVSFMSGNFVQRGEPAIFDKWKRAQSAVLGGVDLVLETPVVYATSNAETFATYAVKASAAIGATRILFGCETANIELLKSIAQFLAIDTDGLYTKVRELMSSGCSFASARERIVTENFPGVDIPSLLRMPNNILAIEYLKAIERFAPSLTPVAFHRETTDDVRYSAGAMRREIFQGKRTTKDSETESDSMPVSLDCFAQALALKLRTIAPIYDHQTSSTKNVSITDNTSNTNSASSTDNTTSNRFEKLSKEPYPYLEPGLLRLMYNNSHLLLHPTNEQKPIDAFIDSCSGKRYTKARIRRILLCILLEIHETDIPSVHDINPNYFHILANDKDTGFAILKQIRAQTDLVLEEKINELITKAKNNAAELSLRELDLSVVATDVYYASGVCKDPLLCKAGREYYSSFFNSN